MSRISGVRRTRRGGPARPERDGEPRPDRDVDSWVGRRVELDVGAVAHGGSCVARHEGRVVFVRHALPGERVTGLITEGGEESRYLRADAVEILRPSPDRVPPPCPYAGPGACGGCDWQHATLQAQRALKAEVIAEQLRRLARVEMPVRVEAVPEPAGADEGQGWRSRVTFAIDETGAAGLRRHRSHSVVPVDRCLIASNELEAIGVEGHRWPGATAVEAIAASGSSDRAVIVTPRPGARMPLVSTDVPASVHETRDGDTRRVHGRPFVREVAIGRTWRVSGGGFWQVHPSAPQVLTDAVLEMLRPVPGESAVDLYCGVGLFAGALADVLGETGGVTGVEEDEQALRDARHNLAELGTVDLVAGRVDRVLRDGQIGRADLVVLDPPRSGAGRTVVEEVVRLSPRAIAYVACDPASLARDTAYFGERGYRLADLRAFDLFPMTHHVECVALLVTAGS